MGELVFRQNYQSSDIANVDTAAVNTAGECSMICETNERCKAMTCVMHSAEPGGICWL